MTNKMENIIGEAIGYDQTIPGTVESESKEFIYFSDDKKNSVRKQFNSLTQFTNPPYAKNGGVTSQGCSLTLPDGSIFHAIAYHGDIGGWRKDIEEAAQALHILLAKIEGDHIVISPSRSFALADCKATFG
jgi:hypothetical protein